MAHRRRDAIREARESRRRSAALGGVLVPPQRYIDGLVRLCAEHGVLIVAEEVQTGIGRTGRALASEHFDLTPDVVVLGKALGSGLPVSAIVARSDLMNRWSSPGHAFSAASSPVLCAAALATLEAEVSRALAIFADAFADAAAGRVSQAAIAAIKGCEARGAQRCVPSAARARCAATLDRLPQWSDEHQRRARPPRAR